MTVYHPRPQLQRDTWMSLDGVWACSFDAALSPERVNFDRSIRVPYPPESPASEVSRPWVSHIWYQRRFEVPVAWRQKRVMLHFGAVDYETTVWINGCRVAHHEGGHTPFSVDITPYLRSENLLWVRADDDPKDMEKPRGKQDWRETPHGIWYPRTTGIWQSVWLEAVPSTHILGLNVIPQPNPLGFFFEVRLGGHWEDTRLRVRLVSEGKALVEDDWKVTDVVLRRMVVLPDPGIDDAREVWLWRPEHPHLFDVELCLMRGEQVLDTVYSYAGLRWVGARDGVFYLNGAPYLLKMVLDQGYWPQTHMAVPDAEAARQDVLLAKSFGFNGVRKHQKVEDPIYLYWADRLGLLVWEEMPAAYAFSPRMMSRVLTEWQQVIERDRNHPSVVAWVPFNESWGISDVAFNEAQRNFVQAVYRLTKAMDPTRPVVDNDGWEHSQTDLFTVHDYAPPEVLRRRYGSLHDRPEAPQGKALSLSGATLRHWILSECGGIRLGTGEGWGYREASDAEALLEELDALMDAVCHSRLAGFCYTQLYDTFQEQNGLATAERKPKIPPEALARRLAWCEYQRLMQE